MSLYKLFTTHVEIQYKSYFLSKAMLFIITTALMNIILPFVIAYRSRGFWLKSHYFYEQPTVRSTYEYLLIIDTDDPSYNIVCGEGATLSTNKGLPGEEYCSETQIEELDFNKDGKNDRIRMKFHINLPPERNIVSLLLLYALDYQITSICPLQMQSLLVISKDFVVFPNEYKLYGDLQLYQNTHLPCPRHNIDLRYNDTILQHDSNNHDSNMIDDILRKYSQREVTTHITNIYSRTQNGKTGSMILDITLKVPETQVRYKPSILQELKWAWPQYLSIAVVFYWIFAQIKLFVFKNRFLMAWEIVTLKHNKELK